MAAATAAASFVDPILGAAGNNGIVFASSDERHRLTDDPEDLLYQMVVWLCSHEVLVQLQDYLIAKFPSTTVATNTSMDRDAENRQQEQQQFLGDDNNNSNPDRRNNYNHDTAGEHKSDTHLRLDLLSDDLILQELIESDCFLSGRISVSACCWKTGLDPGKLYQLVARCPQQLRIVTRLPARGDDWDERDY